MLRTVAPKPVTDIILTTQSTSATWSPSAVTNSGDVLQWEVTGDASGSYTANLPVIDLSANTGTAIITVSSTDWSLVTNFRLINKEIVTANFSIAVGLTSFWLATDPNLISVTGFENLVNLGNDTRLFSNSNYADVLDLRNNTSLTNCAYFYANRFTKVNVTGRTNITNLQIYSNQNIDEIIGQEDLTALVSLNCNTNKLTSLPPNSTLLTGLSCSTNLLSTIDLSPYTLLTSLVCGSNLATTFDTTFAPNLKTINCGGTPLNFTVSTINKMIIDQDAKGLSNGSLNWSGYFPTRTETTTDDVINAYNNLASRGYTLIGNIPA